MSTQKSHPPKPVTSTDLSVRPSLHFSPSITMAWLRTLTRLSLSSSTAAIPKPSFPHLPFYFAATVAPQLDPSFHGLPPTKLRWDKPWVVVPGTGWAGCRLMKGINTRIYYAVCISPCNHMIFTLLLASTCVGTLKFCFITEPVARIHPAASRSPGSTSPDAPASSLIPTRSAPSTPNSKEKPSFYNSVSSDAILVATTFSIHGVEEHAIFLHEVHHALEIYRKLLPNLMLSDVHCMSVSMIIIIIQASSPSPPLLHPRPRLKHLSTPTSSAPVAALIVKESAWSSQVSNKEFRGNLGF